MGIRRRQMEAETYFQSLGLPNEPKRYSSHIQINISVTEVLL